mmetsp:Transcript_8068/g.49850  ORF Transcript_8068/g.49850 Transcript_8068/m.49850 type:complete len:290 (-) Transcript_8068:19-888(-)
MDFVGIGLFTGIWHGIAGWTHVSSEDGCFGPHTFDHALFLVEVGECIQDALCILLLDERQIDVLVVPELGFGNEFPIMNPPGEGLQAEDIFHDRATMVVVVSWFGDVLDEDVGVHFFDGVVDVERFASVLEHFGILQGRQHECRHVFWEEGMFVRTGVSSKFPVHLLGFSQHVIQQGHTVSFGIESRHGNGTRLVDDVVVLELGSHEQSEDDAVFLSEEGFSYPWQGEFRAEICTPAFFLHGTYPSSYPFPFVPSFPHGFGRARTAPRAHHRSCSRLSRGRIGILVFEW